MRNLLYIIGLFFLLVSCASKKEVVEGYEGKTLSLMLSKIQNRDPKFVRKIMGNPAIQGLCKKCGEKGLYRIIYLTKDMSRFYLNLSLNTDQEINCFVLDFLPNYKVKKYIFDRKTGFYTASNCNQKNGAILELQQILDHPQ